MITVFARMSNTGADFEFVWNNGAVRRAGAWQEESKMNMEICGGCGMENPAGARFCARCGRAMGVQPTAQGRADVHPSYGVPVSSGELYGFGALAVLLPGLGSIVSIVMGSLWTSRNRPGGKGFLWFSVIYPAVIMFFVLPLTALPNYYRTKSLAQEAEAKSNLHNIQLSIERYAVDHEGYYPADINEIIKLGYIDAFPRNPLAPRNEAGDYGRAKMKPVADGEFSPGDFVYLPRLNAEGMVEGYELKLYGQREKRGFIKTLTEAR